MNTEEAMKALLNGEKITGDTWGNSAYLTMRNGEIVNSNNYKSSFIPDICWILYSEPKQKVKLYPFARQLKNPKDSLIIEAGYFPTIDSAQCYFGKGFKIYPVNPDGTLEVES